MRFRISPEDGLRDLYLKGSKSKTWRRYDVTVTRAFKRRMDTIKAAADVRDLRALAGLRLEKLERNDVDYSIRLNDQWRLILEIRSDEDGPFLWIKAIEDYH